MIFKKTKEAWKKFILFNYVCVYFSDVPEYWPELANDLTKVVWSHATNSQEKLKKALEGK